MAKAVAKSKKVAEKIAAKSKPSAPARKAAPAASARKALKKPAPKAAAKTTSKPAAKPLAKAPAAKPAISAVKAGKWVYTFGDGKAEGQAGLCDLRGGNGRHPAAIAHFCPPAPPRIPLPTSVRAHLLAHPHISPRAL